MNTTVYLIRHGEVDYKINDQGERLIYGPNTRLSEEGITQITHLAEKLEQTGIKFKAIYTSPYARTKDSALIIAKRLGVSKIIEEKNLRDIWAPGWVGKTILELQAIGGDIYSVPALSEDQETLAQMVDRITECINGIIHQEQSHTIGIVSHGDPTRVFIDKLCYPDRGTVNITRDSNYLGKGQAWKLVFDESFILIERKLIGIEGGLKTERKYY